jgi:hypothetical protein
VSRHFNEQKLGRVAGCAALGRSKWIDGNRCQACGGDGLFGCPEYVAEGAVADYLELESVCRALLQVHELPEKQFEQTKRGVRQDLRELLDGHAFHSWQEDLEVK